MPRKLRLGGPWLPTC